MNGNRMICTSSTDTSSNDGSLSGFLGGIGERSFKAKVGKLIADGRCQDAVDYALRKGKFDMVEVIQAQCSEH